MTDRSGWLIRVPCPTCGPVHVPAGNVVLTHSAGGASYLFRCDNRQGRYYKGCSEHIAGLLEDVAVVNRIELEEHTGPPLSWNDALDMALEMRRSEDFISELIGG